MDLKNKIALIAAGSLVSAGALFAVVTSANAADTPTAPAITSPLAGAEAQDATDIDNVQEGNQNEVNEANDPADANEPNEANDPADANEANEGPEVSGK